LSEESTIEELALLCGIESQYVDNWGHVRQTSLETKKKILKDMGIVADSKGQAEDSLRALKERRSSRLTQPTIVADLQAPPKELVFQIPVEQGKSSAHGLTVSLAITNEQGVTEDLFFTQTDLSFLKAIGEKNTIYHSWSLPFPELKGLGYYSLRLSVTSGDLHESQTISVVMCPSKAYVPSALHGDRRAAGIALSLYGVRSENNWGIGDIGDLKRIIDWVSEHLHGGMIGLNPLHATFNRSPFNTSPYLPISKFYRNYIYLDIPSIEDFRDSRAAQATVRATETRELLLKLRRSKRVLYEEVAVLKMKALRLIFETFLENHWNGEETKTARKRELEKYIRREGKLLENFATFSALDSIIRSNNPKLWTWPQWPEEYHHPGTEAVGQFRQKHWKEILFFKYLQWQLEEQLAKVQEYAKSRGMCIGLYHDLALAIDRFGADFWAYQDFFVSDARVGAPPDAFSQQGQDWGFPPPRIEQLRDDGYSLFVQEIRKNCAFGGALRIDHAMRFFHLYCIPKGEPPSKGAYVSQPYEDFLKILALESVRNEVVIIGEDLGTVPQYVRENLSEANVFSYRLLYFEKDEHQDFIRPQDYPELALVTISTHDLPTFAGFWGNQDMVARKEAGLFNSDAAAAEAAKQRANDKKKLLRLTKDLGLLETDPGENPSAYSEVTAGLHNAIMGVLALTPCKLLVLSQEDLFKEVNQQNMPGTTSQYPNWSLKMKYSVEELFTDHEAKAFSVMFRTWVDRSGRKQPAIFERREYVEDYQHGAKS
jgi:4-alpha-glucanotransferase